MTIPFNIDSNFLNTHTESMLGDLSMNGAFARADPSPALRDQTYVTVEDNTDVLPNSMPLSGLSSGFLSNTTLTGILNPRAFMGTANQITVTDGDGVDGNPTLSLPSDLRLPGTLLAGGDVNLNTHNITTTGQNDISIITGSLGYINLRSNIVTVQQEIRRYGAENTNIYFGSSYFIFNADNQQVLRLNTGGAVFGVNVDVAGHTIMDTVNGIVAVDANIFKVKDEIASISGGVIDFTSPVQFSAATNQIQLPSGTNLQIYASNPLDWIELLANTVNVKKSFIFNSTPTDNMTFVNDLGVHELWFNLNNTTSMILSPIGVTIPGITVVNEIAKYSQTDNNILFGNATQTYNIDGSSVFDINASGFRLGSGYRVNNITNSPSSVLDTDIPTMYAVQTAIGDAVIGANPFRGFWDASGGTYPTTGGTGSGGDIEAGNWWRISVAGTLGGEPVDVGDQLFAGIDDPGQTPANWTNVNPRVFSVFTRTGDIVAEFGDYSFSLISGNIATSQLPNSGVNGANQLVQLNGSGELPALSGVNLTGLTGSLSSSANNLNVSVNGGAASSNVSIINSNVLAVSGTNISSTINGIASNNLSVGFSNLTGTAAISQGGTNNTTLGANGTLAQSDGTKIKYTTATYPDTAGTAGNVLTSDGTNFVSTTLSGGSFGTIWRNNGNYTGDSFSFTTSYKELASFGTTNWALATPNSDFTASVDGQLKYTGAATKTFLVSAYFTVLTSGAGFSIALYVNGSLVSGSESPSPTGYSCVIQNFPITLNQNDYISLYGKRASASPNAIIQMSLSARSV